MAKTPPTTPSADAVRQMELEMVPLAKELKIGSTFLLKTYSKIPLTSQAQFTLDLLRAIREGRREEACMRNCKMAGFGDYKFLVDFETDNLKLPNGVTWDWLCDCAFIPNHENLVLLGAPGTGKTHLAKALGIKACELGHKVFYSQTYDLLGRLENAHLRSKESLNALFKKITSCDLVILDEWGYLPISSNAERLLFQLVNMCYEKRSIIITTNESVTGWTKMFTDQVLLTAIVDRLIHHAYLIQHDGDSYRLIHSTMELRGNS